VPKKAAWAGFGKPGDGRDKSILPQTRTNWICAEIICRVLLAAVGSGKPNDSLGDPQSSILQAESREAFFCAARNNLSASTQNGGFQRFVRPGENSI
jgi:hypothetical protein